MSPRGRLLQPNSLIPTRSSSVRVLGTVHTRAHQQKVDKNKGRGRQPGEGNKGSKRRGKLQGQSEPHGGAALRQLGEPHR